MRLHLGEKLAAYYCNPPDSYYATADRAADRYVPALMPFHCDLVSRVQPNSTVLEVGCGSAHLCPQVEAAGGSYTGMDHGEKLLAQNRQRFPRARFFPLTTEIDETFDMVASLYTIEHVTDPQAYLQRLWYFCRPGGLIAIICPDFVDGDGLAPSFFYGKTARRFRNKLTSFALIDAFKHVLDLLCFAPLWKRRAQASGPGAFWINLAPRIFAGADYTTDADAVHLPRLLDLIWWLEGQGATIVETSRSLPEVDPAILKHNCYVAARKPA
ncbi:MAG: class I SAM-dependent methyltransferase [Chthoniobacterales bacterium]|nr:class I SAM-dependent methyltransferase [Chthoniobacterales bacterium]